MRTCGETMTIRLAVTTVTTIRSNGMLCRVLTTSGLEDLYITVDSTIIPLYTNASLIGVGYHTYVLRHAEPHYTRVQEGQFDTVSRAKIKILQTAIDYLIALPSSRRATL